jgi:hypothetical protein
VPRRLGIGGGGGNHGDPALELGHVEPAVGGVAFEQLVELFALGVAEPHG